MNAHVSFQTDMNEAVQLPRVGSRVRWKFSEGDSVDHLLGGMPAVVVWRAVLMDGERIYGVTEPCGRERTFLEHALRPN